MWKVTCPRPCRRPSQSHPQSAWKRPPTSGSRFGLGNTTGAVHMSCSCLLSFLRSCLSSVRPCNCVQSCSRPSLLQSYRSCLPNRTISICGSPAPSQCPHLRSLLPLAASSVPLALPSTAISHHFPAPPSLVGSFLWALLLSLPQFRLLPLSS